MTKTRESSRKFIKLPMKCFVNSFFFLFGLVHTGIDFFIFHSEVLIRELVYACHSLFLLSSPPLFHVLFEGQYWSNISVICVNVFFFFFFCKDTRWRRTQSYGLHPMVQISAWLRRQYQTLLVWTGCRFGNLMLLLYLTPSLTPLGVCKALLSNFGDQRILFIAHSLFSFAPE